MERQLKRQVDRSTFTDIQKQSFGLKLIFEKHKFRQNAESFGLILQNLNLIYVIGTSLNLIGKLRKEKEFRQQYCRNSTKIGERNRKSWREKEEEFRQHCYRNSSAQIPAWSCVLCAQVWSAQKKKKKSNLWQWHCRKWGKKN